MARDCATMLIDSVIGTVPDGACRLIAQIITEASFPANLAALQMLHTRLNENFEVTDSRLEVLVSCLLKV